MLSKGRARIKGGLETLRHYWPLLTLVVVAAFAYSLFSVLRHWHFGSAGHDLGIVDQAVWHYSRFEIPATTIRTEPTPNLLGDHFSPILWMLTPLYWLFPSASTLLVAQGVLFALGMIPVFLFTRKRLGSLPAYCFAAAYALFWGVQSAVAFDFHEIAFAVPLVAFAMLFMDDRRWAGYFVCISLLLLVKEDMAILVAFFGLCLLAQRQFKHSVASLLLGMLWFLLVIEVFIPSCSPPDEGFGYWTWYDQFGANPGSVVRTIFMNPLSVVRALFVPQEKIVTLLATFCPFALLAFFSPLAMLAVPIVLERFLSDNSLWWGMGFHYTAVLAPIVAMASADGLYRLARLASARMPGERLVVAVSVLVLAVNVGLLLICPLQALVRPSFYSMSDDEASGYRALDCIPPAASVVAQDGVIPHLSRRQEVFLLMPGAPEADYIIAASNLSPWPGDSYEDVERYLAEKVERGYATVYSENGWVVLQRPAPVPSVDDLPPEGPG